MQTRLPRCCRHCCMVRTTKQWAYEFSCQLLVQLLYMMCQLTICAIVLLFGTAVCVLCNGWTCTEQHHTRRSVVHAADRNCLHQHKHTCCMRSRGEQLCRVWHGMSLDVCMCFAWQRV
jgi:hypothetical protein